MYVEVHNGDEVIQIPAERLVVYDELDNPIAAVVRIEPKRYVAVTANHNQFKEMLAAMGITRSVKVDRIDPAKLKPLN